jgi:Helix-turn-helix domain
MPKLRDFQQAACWSGEPGSYTFRSPLDNWKPCGYGNHMVTTTRRQRDAVFRAISDPTRREILGILRGGRQTVGRIAGSFRMSRPAISKHLRLLQAAGLVVTEK